MFELVLRETDSASRRRSANRSSRNDQEAVHAVAAVYLLSCVPPLVSEKSSSMSDVIAKASCRISSRLAFLRLAPDDGA